MDDDTGALDKTWQEIYDADFAVIVGAIGPTGKAYLPVLSAYSLMGSYTIKVLDGGANYETLSFVTSSADGYPVI